MEAVKTIQIAVSHLIVAYLLMCRERETSGKLYHGTIELSTSKEPMRLLNYLKR